ncbi:hypothetical protein ACVBEF_02220 [Glaciimonas sp. GG7]
MPSVTTKSHLVFNYAPKAGSPFYPQQIDSPESRITGKIGRETRRGAGIAQLMLCARSSTQTMYRPPAASQSVCKSMCLPAGVIVVGALSTLASGTSAARLNNGVRYASHVSNLSKKLGNPSSVVVPTGSATGRHQPNNSDNTNYTRNHDFYASVNTFLKNKASKQPHSQSHINPVRSFSFSHNAHNNKRLSATVADKEMPAARPQNSLNKIPCTDLRQAENQAKKSLKRTKILSDVGVKEKEKTLRHPLTRGGKFERLSTDQYLRQLDADALIFLPHNARSTKLIIDNRKPVHGTPLVQDTVSGQCHEALPTQEAEQQIGPLRAFQLNQGPVPDLDLYHFPMLSESVVRDQALAPLRVKRNVDSGYDSVPYWQGTENDARERRTQEDGDEMSLIRKVIPNVTTTTTTITTPFPIPDSASFMRPLTELPVFEAVLLLTLEKVHGCSRQEAQQAYAKLNTEMYANWRNVTSADEIETLWVDHYGFDRDMGIALHHIMDWLGDDAWNLYKEGDHDGAVNLGIAMGVEKYHKRNFADYAGLGVQLYWQMLERRNLEWIDPRRISWQGSVHLNILKAVCSLPKAPVQITQFLHRKPGHTYDILIDQAALVDHTAKMINVHTVSASLMPPSYQEIQENYVLDLIDDLQDTKIAEILIPATSFDPGRAALTYRGGATIGAVGLNAEGIAKALFKHPYMAENPEVMQLLAKMPGVLPAMSMSELDALRRQCTDGLTGRSVERYPRRLDTNQFGDASLTLRELTDIVKKIMNDRLLDTKFSSGSPHHSIVTTLKRVGHLNSLDLRDINDLPLLVEHLNKANARWSVNPQNMFNPALLTALHQATSLELPLLDLHAGDNRAQRTASLIEQQFASVLAHDDLRLWLHHFLPTLSYPGQPDLHSGPDGILPLMSGIDKSYRKYISAPEIITYDSEEDLINLLLKRLNDSVKGYRRPPVFNLNTEIGRILQGRLGMTDAQIHQPKLVSVYTDDRLRREIISRISPIQEFNIKDQFAPHSMEFNGRSIDVQDAMSNIAPAFRAGLLRNEVVRARVMESLRMSGINFSEQDIENLLVLSVTQIMGMPPESLLEAWYEVLNKYLIGYSVRHVVLEGMRDGEVRSLMKLVPFLEGMVEIVQAIATGDGAKAKDGAIKLGEDALGLLVAGIAEKIVASVARKAFQTVAWKATVSAARDLLSMSTLSVTEITQSGLRMSVRDAVVIEVIKEASTHMPSVAEAIVTKLRKVIIESDPHGIAMMSPLDDQSFPALAWRVQRGEKLDYVTPTKDVLPMVDLGQGRVGVVRPGIFCVVLCDLNGRVIPDARPIFRVDTTSNRMAVSEGLPGGSAGIPLHQISERPSIKPLVAYLHKIKGTSGLNDWNSDFLSLFLSVFRFENPAHPEARLFEGYMELLQARSPLMRAVLNNALKKNKGKLIKIVFDADNARADGNTIYFVNAEKLKKIHYMSETGPLLISDRQMWLHESMHLLTGLEDVPVLMKRGHRGANIVISDWVQRESALGPEFVSQRIWYERAYLDGPRGQPVNMAPEQTKSIGKAVDYMNAEDDYVGALIREVSQPSGHPDALINIANPRITILERQKFDALIKQGGLTQWPVQSMLGTWLNSLAVAAETERIRAMIVDVIEPLMQNRRYNQMYSLWIETHHATPLRIKFAPLVQGSGPLEAYQIVRGSEMTDVVINAEKVYYFSAHDNQLMTDDRKLISAFVGLIYPEELAVIKPPHIANPYHDRGLRVIIEEALMLRTAEPLRPRICEALTARVDGWLPNKSSVTQMAKDEDGVLNAMSLAN